MKTLLSIRACRSFALAALGIVTFAASACAPAATQDDDADDGVETSEAAQTGSDVFDASWLDGAPATPETVASWFAPGSRYTVLGHYELRARKRACNPVSGCSAWESPGFWSAYDQAPYTTHPGRIEATIDRSSAEITVRLYGGANPEHAFGVQPFGATCAGAGTGTLSCGAFSYPFHPTTGAWPNVPGSMLAFAPVLTDAGLWAKTTVTMHRSSSSGLWAAGRDPARPAEWVDVEVVLLARFTTLPGENDWTTIGETETSRLRVHAPATWDDANARCRSLGGRLASLSSGVGTPARWTDARRTARAHDDTAGFLSAHEGAAKWLRSEGGRWRSGEPNDVSGEEDCVEATTGGLNDNRCDALNSYACDVEIRPLD